MVGVAGWGRFFGIAYILARFGNDYASSIIIIVYLSILPFFSWYFKYDYSINEFVNSFLWILLTMLLSSLLIQNALFTTCIILVQVGTLLLLPQNSSRPRI